EGELAPAAVDSLVCRLRRRLAEDGIELPRRDLGGQGRSERRGAAGAEPGIIPSMVRVFTDLRCLEHRVPRGYPERPERLSGIVEHLRAQGWAVEEGRLPEGGMERVEEAVAAVHDEGYVERFRRAVERGDALLDSADNPLSQGTWTAG